MLYNFQYFFFLSIKYMNYYQKNRDNTTKKIKRKSFNTQGTTT